jgi:hypothetical protein
MLLKKILASVASLKSFLQRGFEMCETFWENRDGSMVERVFSSSIIFQVWVKVPI